MKLLFYLITALIPFKLFSACLNNSECRYGRICLEEQCVFAQDLEERRNAGFMLERFFEAVRLGAVESFILSENEYGTLADKDYEEYRNRVLGAISSMNFSGKEEIVSVATGDPRPFVDSKGKTLTARIGNSILYRGKLGRKRMDIESLIYLNGRWSILSVFRSEVDN